MNPFIEAAIVNMEWVEYDHDRERPIIELREQKTQEAIAYALIAIAEALQGTVKVEAWTHDGDKI